MPIFLPPVFGDAEVRVDRAGNGWFSASRGGRAHLGIDLYVEPGEILLSPCAGRFVRWGNPYTGSSTYKLFEIAHDGCWQVRVFYCEPLGGGLTPLHIELRQKIARAQDITSRYPDSGMLNHVHVECRTMDERVIPTGVRRIQKNSWWYCDGAVLMGVKKVRRGKE